MGRGVILFTFNSCTKTNPVEQKIDIPPTYIDTKLKSQIDRLTEMARKYYQNQPYEEWKVNDEKIKVMVVQNTFITKVTKKVLGLRNSKAFFALGIACLPYTVLSQTLGMGFGWVATYTHMPVPMIEAKNSLYDDGTDQWYIASSYPIYSKWNIMGSYTRTLATTRIQIRFDGKEGDFSRTLSGVILRQIEMGIGYNILNKKNQFFISPHVLFGLQFSSHYAKYGNFFPIAGPYYWQTKNIESKGYNITQATISLGVKLGFKILRRVKAGINLKGFYAPRIVQELQMYYYHISTPHIERYAEFESSGTGLYRSAFVEVILGTRQAKRTKNPNKNIDFNFN